MIADLLPLYKDGVCSPASVRAVEDHLAECPECRELLRRMDDIRIDGEISREKDEVLGSQARFFKRKSAVAGAITAAVFAIPVLICLIVNLVNGNGLGWFYIVMAAMLIPASLIVVPLMAPENKMFMTMVSFTASIILLLAAVCIYNKGSWFFIAASSVLFGLTVCFAPFIVSRRPVSDHLNETKGLAVMSAYTITYALMLICIGLSIHTPGFFRAAFGISAPFVGMAWILFLVIRYLPANGLVKAGASLAAVSVFLYYGSSLIMFITDRLNSTGFQVYAEPSLPLMLAGLAAAAVLAAAGFITGTKEPRQ